MSRKLPWLSQTRKAYPKSDGERFRNTRRWQKIRLLQITSEPTCRHCEHRGRLKEAEEVDHIIPIADGGDPWDLDNLQSLCKRCHRMKTAKENAERNKTVSQET